MHLDFLRLDLQATGQVLESFAERAHRCQAPAYPEQGYRPRSATRHRSLLPHFQPSTHQGTSDSTQETSRSSLDCRDFSTDQTCVETSVARDWTQLALSGRRLRSSSVADPGSHPLLALDSSLDFLDPRMPSSHPSSQLQDSFRGTSGFCSSSLLSYFSPTIV